MSDASKSTDVTIPDDLPIPEGNRIAVTDPEGDVMFVYYRPYPQSLIAPSTKSPGSITAKISWTGIGLILVFLIVAFYRA
jgi:hypothetical protein